MLRVIRNGLLVKAIVDDAIDRCSVLSFNIRDAIEDSRLRGEQTNDAKEKKFPLFTKIFPAEETKGPEW